MKIGDIIKPNAKGQVVIPKAIRKLLGINPNVPLHLIVRGNGIYIYPVKEIIGESTKTEKSYLNILARTKGAWSVEIDNKKKKSFELKASTRRKRAW